MDKVWNTQYISSDNIIKVARGKSKVVRKYLEQFQELVPSRIALLRQSLQNEDRESLRKTLHQISPQLQFFGVPGVVPPIKRISMDYQSMPWHELQQMTEEIIGVLEQAQVEVAQVSRTI